MGGPGISKAMIKFVSRFARYATLALTHSLSYETIVDVEGVLVAAPSPVLSCTQSSVEIHVQKVTAARLSILKLRH